MQHIHVGAGNFGLGFVCWLFAKAGQESIILNRSPSPHDGGESLQSRRNRALLQSTKYGVSYIDLGAQDRLDVIQYKYFGFCDSQTDLAIVEGYLQKSREVILTISVKSIVAALSIAEILSRLKASNHIDRIYVIAMENAYKTSDLKRRLPSDISVGEKIVFVDAVVDRICSDMVITDANDLIISAERYARLVLDGNVEVESIRSTFSGVSEVIFSDRINIYERAKLSVLNAAHIFVAGDAQYFQMPSLNFYLTVNDIGLSKAPSLDDRIAHLRRLLDELRIGVVHDVLCTYGQGSDEVRLISRLTQDSELEAVVRRFSRVPDTVSRILGRLKSPSAKELHTMSDFLRSMLGKVKLPIAGYVDATDTGPPSITISFLRIAELIAHQRFVTREVSH